MSSESESRPDGPPESSPFPGCLILSTIILVFGGLIILYTVVGSFQNRKLDEFTRTEPVEVRVMEPTEAEREESLAKVGAIGAAIEEGRAERFLLTATDLNVLIATREELSDFRGQTWIERVSPQGIVAHMVQPMRKGVFGKGVRYLDATFVLEPELRPKTIAFVVRDIRPAVGEAPEGFIDNYRVLDFFRLDPEWDVIATSVPAIGAIYTEGSHVVVETKVDQGDELGDSP